MPGAEASGARIHYRYIRPNVLMHRADNLNNKKMSDLEKTPSNIDGALPTSGETPEVTTDTAAEAPVQETVAVAETEPESETADISGGADDAARSWHDMDKQQLLAELKEIVETGDTMRHRDVAAIKQAFHALRTKELDRQMAEFIDAGNSPDAFAATPDEDEYAFKDYIARFKEARSKFLADEEVRLENNLKAKRDIIAQLNDIAGDIDNINVHYPRFRELTAEFKNIKDVTPGTENEVWKEYQTVVELFYDRLKMNKELRDLDFRKNLEIKRELIEKARELETRGDVVAAFRQMQEYVSAWRETGPVAKEYRDSIWEEFNGATSAVYKRHQQFFEERKAAEKANEEAKTKICEEIEAIDITPLDTFNKWESVTKDVLALQARWKELGYASKKSNNLLFARFRESCDRFFGAKAAFYKRVKAELAENLEKKIALCERAEALIDDTETEKPIDRMIALQNEWRSIGGVPRRQSDAVWARFTAACNKFFDKHKRRQSSQRKDENDNLTAKRAIIEELKAIDIEQTPRREGIDAVKALQEKWKEIGHVPFRVKDKVYAEYREQCDRIFNGYDRSARRNRRSDFEGRINDIPAGDAKLVQERERLYRAYEQKRGELKTYENNLGFFNVKSKDGNSMLREMERKVEKIKSDLDELKKKIELIDEKMD